MKYYNEILQYYNTQRNTILKPVLKYCLKSGSDGIETEHLESEGLVQTGDENWKHQVKLNDVEMQCLLEKWQTKKRELNKKYKSWKINLKRKEVPRRSWNYSSRRKPSASKLQKDNEKLVSFYTGFENYEVFSMVFDPLGGEKAAHLDYQNTEK